MTSYRIKKNISTSANSMATITATMIPTRIGIMFSDACFEAVRINKNSVEVNHT